MREGGAKVLVTLLFMADLLEGGLHIQIVPTSAPRPVSTWIQKELSVAVASPRNDRWHPWPFFRRLYDAAVSLDTEYVIMLEPDNTVLPGSTFTPSGEEPRHSYVKRPPPADVGGLLVCFGDAPLASRCDSGQVDSLDW